MVKLSESIICGRTKISSVENVRRLNCWGCDLDDVSIVERMPNIEVLSLSVNKITSLKPFAACKRLRELYMRGNCIKDLSELAYLQNLNELRILWLDENPCANDACYRNVVLKMLPFLTSLDNQPVSPNELVPITGQSCKVSPAVVVATSKPHEDSVASYRSSDHSRFGGSNLINNNSSFTSDNGCESILATSSADNYSYQENNQSYDENYCEFAQKACNVVDSTSPKLPKRGYRRNYPQKTDNDNVLKAVVLLLDELDDRSLRFVMREAEKRICDNYN